MEPRDLSLNPEQNGASEETLKAAEAVETADAVTVVNENSEESISEAEIEPVAELPVEEQPVAAPAVALQTKDEILAAACELVARDAADISGDEMSRLKQQYYALHHDELRREREAFIENGGAADDFTPAPDPVEEQLKELFAQMKEKKAALRAEIEARQAATLARKEEIIAKIIQMSEDTDNVHRHFQEVKDLQVEFKNAGDVDDAHTATIWKKFNDAVEHYYDQHKINKELRDYDFKKNLAEKELLCEQAEKLNEETDIILAFKRLQDLHEKWRQTGPVAKDIRESLWLRFKDASTAVNKKYQAFFEERKAKERENEEAKTAICERLEALDFSTLSTYAAWDEMTQTIMQAQAEWRSLGYASKKMNNALFARFRAVCDNFFSSKAEFFKRMKDTLAETLADAQLIADDAYGDMVQDLDNMLEEFKKQDEARENMFATAQGLVEGLDAGYEGFAKSVNDYITKLNELAQAAQIEVSVSNIPRFESTQSDEVYGPPKPDGYNLDGLSYVPYNDYLSYLHKGEAVLTAAQADDWRAGRTGVDLSADAIASAVSGAVARALSGLTVQMDGQTVGHLVAPTVSSDIAEGMITTRHYAMAW